MLSEPTLEKMKELTLYGMADAFIEQQKNSSSNELSFEERLALLIDAEWIVRHNKRLTRKLREAKLRISSACIEDVETSPARGLDKGTLLRLASCGFVVDKMPIIITGATGTGKTHLACALAAQACRKGYRAIYKRASRLYDELFLAKADGTYPKMLQKLARVDVLILDDFGLTKMREQDRQTLLDVLEDRFGNRSTIITSQLPPKMWHEYIDSPTIADSICDRVVHTAYRVNLAGASRRQMKKVD